MATEPERRLVDRIVLRVGTQVEPLVKEFLYRTRPPDRTRWLYAAAFHVHAGSRELGEWWWRSFLATPIFLARCARHGSQIAVDRVPYMTGACNVEVGNNVRISGLISIRGGRRAESLLTIGNGVFIGSGTTIIAGKRVSIGNYSSIGAGTYIADTDGHTHMRHDAPIWEDPPGASNVAGVIIDDNVHISRHCTILKGVHIGARSVIGAGSVVRSNVPPDCVVAGNPARVIWRRRPLSAMDTADSAAPETATPASDRTPDSAEAISSNPSSRTDDPVAWWPSQPTDPHPMGLP